MAAFPNLPFDAETTEELLDDLKIDRATNGAAAFTSPTDTACNHNGVPAVAAW